MADFIQAVYSSRPFGYDSAILSNILLDARRCNARDNITGALICRQDIFLQLLEGPTDAVNQTLARIRRDDRHVEMEMRVSEPVNTRLFADWAMLHDPENSWIWSREDISNDILDRSTPGDFRKVFETLAAKHTAPS